MKKLALGIFLLLLPAACGLSAYADDLEHDFKIATYVGNTITPNGTSTSNTGSINIRPYFSYNNSWGFYSSLYLILDNTEGTDTITTKKATKVVAHKKIENITFDVGYDYSFNNGLSVGVEYTYSKYSNTSQNAGSNPHTMAINTSWENDAITPSLSYMCEFGKTKKPDYTVSFDLTKVFIFPHIFTSEDMIIIPLTLGSFAGTTNYDNRIATANSEANDPGFKFTSAYGLISAKYRIKWFGFGLSTFLIYNLDPASASTFVGPLYNASVAAYF